MTLIDTNFPDEMSKQDIFDYSINFLLKQNVRSAKDGACLYRGPNNTACGVGCLIRDDEYLPIMDHKGSNALGALIRNGNLPLRLVPRANFLSYIQALHDCYEPSEWYERAIILAKENNLSMDNIVRGET